MRNRNHKFLWICLSVSFFTASFFGLRLEAQVNREPVRTPQVRTPNLPKQSQQKSTRTVQTPATNLSGNWDSNLGSVSLRQSGNRVSGTLRFSNGAVATLTGTVQGTSFSFRWNVPNSQVHGDGTLTASANGARLSGPYTDRSAGTQGQSVLTRKVIRPSTPPSSTPRVDTPRTNRSNSAPDSRTSFQVARPAELNRLTSDAIRDQLRLAVQHLETQLDAWRSGGGWKKYLATEQLKISTSRRQSGIPDPKNAHSKT